MQRNFNPYKPLIGMSLTSISFGKTYFSLEFHKPEEGPSEIVRLSSMADICLKEGDIFQAHSEFEIVNPNCLGQIYSVLETEVLDFKPMNKHRACRMDFENLSIFTWANSGELPDCLYDAWKNPQSDNPEWWLIDDQ